MYCTLRHTWCVLIPTLALLQVHSGPFHVSFDLTRHQALGYCLPEWAPLPLTSHLARAAISACVQLRHTSSSSPATAHAASSTPPSGRETAPESAVLPGTCIVLPFKQELLGSASARGEALLRRFADISPTLLLFLQRLRVITIRNCTSGTGGGGGGDPKVDSSSSAVQESRGSAQQQESASAAAAAVGADARAGGGGGDGNDTTAVDGLGGDGDMLVMRRVRLAPHLLQLSWGPTGSEHSST